MRWIPFSASLIGTLLLIVVLSMQWGDIPPLGRFLSPQHGFWLNAEPVNKSYDDQLNFDKLNANAEVYFDERMVPHVFASSEQDAFFVQGYLHAKFRLWQMEFQTHAAAGRLSEILGAGPDSAILNNDRTMRRLGMVYGAMNSLKAIEADSESKSHLDAYTSGVNAYIGQLTNADLPLEYRLLNYEPELWSNFKTALFLMYMSYELTGQENDIEYTNARKVFNSFTFDKLYPITQDSLDPIVPPGTIFDTASVKVKMPMHIDSLYFSGGDSLSIVETEPDRDNGSNNWAVNGSKTASGRPILCNDPHLGINLPSLWYEMQISVPGSNVYGASFPGAPAVIIGFNDSIAWGVTNAEQDVKDYYAIQFNEDRSQYLFNGAYLDVEKKVEEYRIKGGGVFLDTVSYTLIGPVMYDRNFDGNGRAEHHLDLAVRWKAHDGNNEMKSFIDLNRAKNYSDYRKAIDGFSCPGQNFVFASKSNDIAIWQMGSFPAKWKRQGDFIMPGTDSTYFWQADIPKKENAHHINPERGFVSSANQHATDSTYPYYVGGTHDLYRGRIINRKLAPMQNITPADMLALQNDNSNLFAQDILPLLIRNVDRSVLNDLETRYLQIVEQWNYRNDPDENGATVFTVWFDSLQSVIWLDELQKVKGRWCYPQDFTLVEGLLRDSIYIFTDNVNTPEKETLMQQVTAAFRKAVPELQELENEKKLSWSKYKDSGVRHLLRIAALSRFHLRTGGGPHIVNATKRYHAPSWKMIVHLTDDVEAYGIYPGGQIGNPGSRYYDNFVDDWVAGKNYRLWLMKADEKNDKRILSKMTFSKS